MWLLDNKMGWLFQDFFKRTPENHPDHGNLSKALTRMVTTQLENVFLLLPHIAKFSENYQLLINHAILFSHVYVD